MPNVVSMKLLLEAGVHFGHQTRRWDPRMKPYIFTERNGIHIIDLQQTVVKLNEAYSFVRDLTANGGSVLFVGTKKQAQEAIKTASEQAGQPYVNQRWLGGMLTNWTTVRKRISRLGQSLHLFDPGEQAIEPSQLLGELACLLLREALEVAGLLAALELLEPLEPGLDRPEVGEHAAEPALIDVILASALRLGLDRLLRLLLRADEEHGAAVGGEVADERVGLV